MSEVVFPDGFRLVPLERGHRRRSFNCGDEQVNDWLWTKAHQHQKKHLSSTKVLIDSTGAIAGFYTLATGQADFGDLPADLTRKLPRRVLPVAILAWLGVGVGHQKRGLGERLLASALRDCHDAGKTFAFIAVVIDCLNDAGKSFYNRWGFSELPGHPYRLILSTKQLDAMVAGGRS